MPYIKNITHEEVVSLSKQISIQTGQIVRKTLARNASVSMTLFAFSKGEEISTHHSHGDAMALVLEGSGQFIMNDVQYLCKAGDVFVMPAEKPHAVFAVDDFKMLLTVIFPVNS